jgi:hypothetical protein
MGNDKAVEQPAVHPPALTGTTHTLPFDKLSPRDFERLCLWLVEREGYERAEHLGAAGSEQGRDLLAWRGAELWAFQCKRVQRFYPKQALAEVEKVLALPGGQRPVGLVFLVTCDVSAETRQQARDRCAGEGLACRFWTGTELDHKVKGHPDIVTEFFRGAAPAGQGPGPAGIQASDGGVVQVGEGNIAFTGTVQGGVHIVQGGSSPAPSPPAGSPGSSPLPGPDLSAVRDLLLDAFAAADLRRLVLYTGNAELRRLGQEFADGDGLTAMVEKAIRFCQARQLLPDLLREVERENPRQYRRYAHRL